MDALRIIIKQNSANYRKEEAMDNKMTYPLPPISTIIGAIHNACNYREYHPMDISIQGKYESMHKEPYTDYCFLNRTIDDRGILVKMANESMLSKGFEKVATSKKQGSDMRTGLEIQVHNAKLLEEYRSLKNLNDEIKKFKDTRQKKFLELTKKRKKGLSEKKKNLDKKSDKYKRIVTREKEIKRYENKIKTMVKEFEEENYTKPVSRFRTLTTSLKFYEILNNIELVIHIRSKKETLEDILENIYNLKAIGRSEDFVEVVEAKMVDIIENDLNHKVKSEYSAYIDYESVINKKVYTKVGNMKRINGTKYYINKNYDPPLKNNNRRIFNKVKVVYISNYLIKGTSENIYIDSDGDKEYIVNFL